MFSSGLIKADDDGYPFGRSKYVFIKKRVQGNGGGATITQWR